MLFILGIPHLSYQLILADILVDNKPIRTWLCASRDFRQRGERKIALDEYFSVNRTDEETPLAFCIRNGWSEYIRQMLVIDYLILNRDRHGANIEVLANRYRKTIRLAPLFDHGLSFFFHTPEEQLEKEDVMAEKPVQCFVGSRSAAENLKLIPKEKLPKLKTLNESDKAVLLHELDGILSQTLQDKIWEMIWKRWCAYEDLCNSR